MQSPVSTSDAFAQHYATAIDALCKVGRSYYTFGRLGDAQRLLDESLRLIEASEAQSQDRLKLLLLYTQVLLVDHLLRRGDSNLLFSVIQEARQLAETTRDQQRIADALSLLGQAYYCTTIVASLKRGESPNSLQGQGLYDEALAYQEQALTLREALNDRRGISESRFQIGVVYERWQQYDRSQAYYREARQIADQYGYALEKTEPARHAAIHALRQGQLDEALALAKQALELREAAGFKPYLPLDHLLLRDVYLAKGDTTNAQHEVEIASALAQEMGLTNLVASMPNRRDVLGGPQAQT